MLSTTTDLLIAIFKCIGFKIFLVILSLYDYDFTVPAACQNMSTICETQSQLMIAWVA